jgi:hypothetical protein
VKHRRNTNEQLLECEQDIISTMRQHRDPLTLTSLRALLSHKYKDNIRIIDSRLGSLINKRVVDINKIHGHHAVYSLARKQKPDVVVTGGHEVSTTVDQAQRAPEPAAQPSLTFREMATVAAAQRQPEPALIPVFGSMIVSRTMVKLVIDRLIEVDGNLPPDVDAAAMELLAKIERRLVAG